LGPNWPTLPKELRSRGYATGGFVANALFAGWEAGFSRGFEHFDDYPISLWTATEATAFGRVIYPPLQTALAPILNRLPILWRLRLPPSHNHPSAQQINGAFLAWLDRRPKTPFFAFLNFMDAHRPNTPPDSFLVRFRSRRLRPLSDQAWKETPTVRLTPADVRPRRDIYDAGIAYLDSQLGDLFRELDRRGLLNNTLIIVAADHGNEFAEHGLVEHGNSLYRLSVEVPLVLSFPGHVPEGRRVAEPVSLRNLAATVIDLLPPGQQARFPGRSLARFWTGAGETPDTIIATVEQDNTAPAWYPISQGDLESVAYGGFRYIRNEGTGIEELYDFEHDVLERWDLAGTDSGQRLLPHYRAALAAAVGTKPGPPIARR
jgi:arylsulfatase A-like enzyme